MSADSPRHVRSGGPLTVPSQPPSDRSIIDAVSGFINDVTLSSSSTVDPKDIIQWARFETADINEPTSEGDGDSDVSPLLLILGYGAGVQVWLIPPAGEAQEVLSWRQGVVRVLRILPTPQHGDCFASKRPLIALCDSASPGPSFCALSFISIRGGEQVKSIKFKNPILDVLANKRSVVVSFSERFAVFDAANLEDRMAVTTCYPCPCPLGGSLPINPLTLGDRWLAYADKKLNQSKRSNGGCEAEGVTSYTATVLHAAKSLSKGLRGLGESVAHSLAGGRTTSQSPSPPNTDIQQPGIVTIMDIEGNEEEDGQDNDEPCDPIVAHFVAHSEAIIALKFDSSGMLLVTADRRGHDFHVFRINPHPCGPSLASVHHLYILHRGDTTAKVQDISISCDARWTAVSTLRGTTHVFAISPYGGVCGVRTHTAPRVVNRLSRFHRSAGLPIHAAGKRASPSVDTTSQGAWFPNPRLPPFPAPLAVSPLAQLRPTANIPTHTITRTSSGRQRLSSLSEDSNSAPLLARARFGPPPATCARSPAPVAALYLMAANGALLHLLLHPKPLASIPKEKLSDESCIELEVWGVAQWVLQRPAAAADLLAPLPPSNPLLQPPTCRRCADICMSEEERWLSQVEIVTHAGPHRRLWMGPQFVFKTYTSTGSTSSLSEAETVEVDPSGPARSNPVNMPGVRPVVPVLIDSGSASSLEHSPSDSFRRKSLLAESGRAPSSVCDVQLRQDLAEAMKEDHGAAIARSADVASSERAWAVDPAGYVVQPAPGPDGRASPVEEAELYASSNCDESTFRPVVRAPAPLRPEAAARALPATTTIPAQSVAPRLPAAAPATSALPTDVLIPAALTPAALTRGQHAPADPLQTSSGAGDVPPPAEFKVKNTPTSTSIGDPLAGDGSFKCSESRLRGSSRPRDYGEGARVSTSSETHEREECKAPSIVVDLNNINLEVPDEEEKLRKPVAESTIKVEQVKKIESVKGKKVTKLEFARKQQISRESSSRRSLGKETISDEQSPKNVSKESASKESFAQKIAISSRRSLGKETISDEQSPKTVSKESASTESFAQQIAIASSRRSLEKETISDEQSPKTVSIESASEESFAQKIAISGSRRSLGKETITDEQSPKNVTIESASKETFSQKIAISSSRRSLEKEPNTNKPSVLKESASKETFAQKITLSSSRPSLEKEPNINKQSVSKEPVLNEFQKSSISKRSTEKETPSNEESKRIEKESLSKEPFPQNIASNDPIAKEQFSKNVYAQPVPVTPAQVPTISLPLKYSTKKKLSEPKAIKENQTKSYKEKTSKAIKENESETWKETIESKDITFSKDLKDEIKTEEQTWDLLLNEPEKLTNLTVSGSIPIVDEKALEEPKVKPRKGRKGKKLQDDTHVKEEVDTFVEIHAIEDKQQESSDELVSISNPYEEIEQISFFTRTKKSQASKSITPERKDQFDLSDNISLEQELTSALKCDRNDKVADIKIVPDISIVRNKRLEKETDVLKSDAVKVDVKPDNNIIIKEPVKPKKSKSLSPYVDRKMEKLRESEVKDVYVIDTVTDEFPEIQITKGKLRKKSPQPEINHEVAIVETPVIKSWSTIAASKNLKKEEVFIAEAIKLEPESSKTMTEIDLEKETASSAQVSLQEKLIELCKRTDIVLAECDTPTELNFVDEHHTVIDLPPLESLDFGLDDFNLEVMRDSLLDASDTKVTSPICKINIDSILSTIKETTNKAIESSAFNLIDLEKMPLKKERGFSVVENDKITTQEVKIDEDKSEGQEVMEKSSDDDNPSKLGSTDSDKDDKKSTGAANVFMPSTKQSTKPKKTRKKKK